VRRVIVAVLIATWVLTVAAGCGDPCAELQDICNTCADPNHFAACESSVDLENDDECEQNIDSYGNVCN
jgi:hypothetical protein